MQQRKDITSLWENNNFPILEINKSTNINLSDLQNKHTQLDPYFIRTGCIQKDKDRFDTLWNNFKKYADFHFLKECEEHFHERTWEMWFGNYLLKKGLNLTSLNVGPDFIINDKIYIECVCANKGEKNKTDSIPELREGIQDFELEKYLLRLSNSVSEKFNKHKGWEINNTNFITTHPYIIAINTAELPFPLEIGDYFGALCGLGDQTYNSKTKEWGYIYRPDIKKSNGSKVTMQPFNLQLFENISAIIFSKNYILSSDEEIIKSMFLVHNPLAKNPLDMSIFNDIDQWIADEEKYNCIIPSL